MMHITVSGQQMNVTSPLRKYVTNKLERIERHFDHVTNTNVVLHVEKTRHLAEATIKAKGTTLHANAEAEDMYAAIDALTSKLDRQVKKHKEKATRHYRNGGTLKDQALK
jgi:putative sigma-54 modulation protein